MAFVAGAVPRAPSITAAARAGAFHVNVLGYASEESRKPLYIADPRTESLAICGIGAADRALSGIELVGAWLTLMQYEPGVMARARGFLAHFSAVECRQVWIIFRPMS